MLLLFKKGRIGYGCTIANLPGQSVAATENYDVNKWNEMTPEEQQGH